MAKKTAKKPEPPKPKALPRPPASLKEAVLLAALAEITPEVEFAYVTGLFKGHDKCTPEEKTAFANSVLMMAALGFQFVQTRKHRDVE